MKLSVLLMFFSHFIIAQIIITNPVSVQICDNNNDGVEAINLTNYNTLFSNNPIYTYTYYTTLTDANLGITPVTPIQMIFANKTFYVRVSNPGNDFVVGQLNVIFLENCNMSTLENLINRISVYPNPAKDFIKISSDEKVKKIEVYSISGQKILTTEYATINVSRLSKGIYFLKIFTEKSLQNLKFEKK